jgi:hypothetical protein
MKELVTGKAASYDVWRRSRVAVWNRGLGVWNESGPTHQMFVGWSREKGSESAQKEVPRKVQAGISKNPTKVRTSGIEAPQ